MSAQVAGTTRAKREGPLILAVPRGTLHAETLDRLDAIGVDTDAVRADSRSLIFETPQLTLLTVRPSDVPTYVESGAADLGITGKDVLLEQEERPVYELVDLDYGECRMVVATREAEESLDLRERRFGRVKIATKYLNVAKRHFEATGRQVELVEIKGSVELAPLVGLADGIVDLVASGRTLAENGLVEREQIERCTARLVANPVSHKLRASEVDALAERLRATVG
ncbi:MAG TPA: ATP phosphoribosyltransferase [Solirubrobacterales bacterium]|nr:ATP phosphoribosyltransferase [Solirubrobacterales bacterium]